MYVSGTIDREKYNQITLYITASYRDKPNTRIDHALIQLNILDTNDNYPIFTRKQYHTQIYMNTQVNESLLRIEANDQDSGLNGQVEYSIDFDTNYDQNLLSMDSSSGVIRLASSLSNYLPFLARKNFPKNRQSLSLSVSAKDKGSPALVSKAILNIKIIFNNDQSPIFDYVPLVFDFYEKQPVGTKIGIVTARDPDLAPSLADITFKLLNLNNLFRLESSGIYNNVWLVSNYIGDYEKDENKHFNLTVRAYSGSLHADTFIIVNLKDLNDQEFKLQKTSFKLVFNNYKNYFLIERSARVPFQLNNMIEPEVLKYFRFNLTDSIGKQLVNLNWKTGEIILRPILNSNNQINASFAISINGNFI